MDKKDLVAVRAMNANDHNFILATFLRGFYYGDSWAREINKDVFMSQYHKVVETLIASPNNIVQVACLKEDPEVILGYSILGANTTGVTVHWVFVKSAWRGIGLAKSLIPLERVNTTTHLTKVGLSILRKHPEITYNPFLLS